MKLIKLCAIGGDGIGPDVLESGLKVLKKLVPEIEIKFEIAGYGAYQKHGRSLPDHTLQTCRNSDVILFGAVTTPPLIKNYQSPIIRIRQELNLYANVRPFFSLPIKDTCRDIDLLIIRENTQGLYSGIEKKIDGGFSAERIITKKASERILSFAFSYAQKRRKKVTVIHKANILRLTDGLFLSLAKKMAKKYPQVECNDMLVDTCAFQLIKNPQSFDVIVTTNMFGDILSDEVAGLIGGLGVCASANIGPHNALFEPVHGSAPKYAGQDKVNPMAMLFAVCMMLDYLSLRQEADLLRKTTITAIKKGNVTYDLGGKYKTSDVVNYIMNNIK